ncbi:hypothetical protein, partial [Roseovarius indicus]|uniref:hypothetical protein n=1 Tax=Roseovarius indicus TaxID=540747 RepID=UPI0035137309
IRIFRGIFCAENSRPAAARAPPRRKIASFRAVFFEENGSPKHSDLQTDFPCRNGRQNREILQ